MLCEKLIHVVALCEGVQQEENERITLLDSLLR